MRFRFIPLAPKRTSFRPVVRWKVVSSRRRRSTDMQRRKGKPDFCRTHATHDNASGIRRQRKRRADTKARGLIVDRRRLATTFATDLIGFCPFPGWIHRKSRQRRKRKRIFHSLNATARMNARLPLASHQSENLSSQLMDTIVPCFAVWLI